MLQALSVKVCHCHQSPVYGFLCSWNQHLPGSLPSDLSKRDLRYRCCHHVSALGGWEVGSRHPELLLWYPQAKQKPLIHSDPCEISKAGLVRTLELNHKNSKQQNATVRACHHPITSSTCISAGKPPSSNHKFAGPWPELPVQRFQQKLTFFSFFSESSSPWCCRVFSWCPG